MIRMSASNSSIFLRRTERIHFCMKYDLPLKMLFAESLYQNSSFSRISSIFSMGPQCYFILRKFRSRNTIQFRFEIVNLYECFLELNKKYAFFSFERNYETFITLLGLLISTRLGSHYFIAWTWYVNFATHVATPRRKHRRPNNIYICTSI